MVDILNIQPTVISRDLKGKYILIYGKPKTGKTTLASRFPNNLLVAFEKGYNAIDGIKAVDINKWIDFKLVLRQLEKPEAQKMYDTITIDTATIAYEMCEQFVCSQNGVQSIRDIAWGQGWGLAKKEFENCLRKITMLGYGLVLISHIEIRKEKVNGDDDNEIEMDTVVYSKNSKITRESMGENSVAFTYMFYNAEGDDISSDLVYRSADDDNNIKLVPFDKFLEDNAEAIMKYMDEK